LSPSSTYDAAVCVRDSAATFVAEAKRQIVRVRLVQNARMPMGEIFYRMGTMIDSEI